jgi:SAM-dependent methyltransferase
VYSSNWYQSFLSRSAESAAVIVPLLLDLCPARSVVDVGCGLGVWLREFQRRGVQQVLGVDGPHVKVSDLQIPEASFYAHDLTQPFRAPDSTKFELAVCLEVAEHLPASSAVPLVASLTSLAPAVFFSAAIPAQGGTRHVNEQWLEYWIERFAKRDYQVVDAIRPQIWDDSRIDFWYAQNAVLFVRRSALSNYPRLQLWRQQPVPRSVVHPALFLRTQRMLESTLDFRLKRLARRVKYSAQRLIGRSR